MDVAASTPIRIHVTLWQLIGAIATCTVLFGAGFAVGRITADDETAVALPEAEPLVSSADRAADGAADADNTLGMTGAEGGEGSTGDGGLASGGVTVEGLETALTTVDHQRITFEPGTSQLTADASVAATEVATILVANPFIPVEVEIRTFTEATPGENHGLSVLQAEAVVAALVANGVDPARMTAVGLGGSDEKPEGVEQFVRFASNDTAIDDRLGTVDFLSITFDDGGRLTGGDETIRGVAETMATNPSATLDLIGYAYLSDPDTSHDRSHAIADVVIAQLVALGLDNDRIDVVGMGDTPIQVEGNTEIEFEVGSPAALTLALRQVDESRIQFVSGTADLTPDGAAALVEVANALQLDPGQRVEVSAHSYSESTSADNHRLSHLVGDAVVRALADAGVSVDRLELRAHGDPIAFRNGTRANYISFYPLD